VDEQANKLATQATVRFALAQGYLSEEQVREALHIQRALEEAGTPAQLLAVLGNRFLASKHLPELGEVYRIQLARAQGAGASAPLMEAPPAPGPISVKLSLPKDLLDRSVELLRRPAADDPEALRKYLTESEHADVALPTISDRVFVSLAKKAGYPDRGELIRCRELQLVARKGGDPITLFEIVRKQNLLSARRINRFLRWSAMIRRKESAPLEDNEAPVSAPQGVEPSQPRVLVPSAASFQATVERCGRCAAELDDLGVMEGRVRQTERGLVCVPCSEGKVPASPLPEYTRPTPKKKRKRRVRRALAKSKEFVVNRLGSDPQRAERRFTQLVAGTAGVGLVFGLGLGAIVLSKRSKPVVPPPVAVGPQGASTDPEADAAWAALRRGGVERAERDLLAFAEAYPRDPRAADASRFAALIEEAHLAGRRESGAGRGAAGMLLEEARRAAQQNPAQALALLERVQKLDGGSVSSAAQALEDTLRGRAKSSMAVIRKRAKELERTAGPTQALEYVLRTSRSRWHGLDGGAHDALVRRLVMNVEAAATLSGGRGTRGGSRDVSLPPPRRVTPRGPSPVRDAGTTTRPPSGVDEDETVLAKFFEAYDKKDRGTVETLTSTLERQLGRNTAEARAARGLQHFLNGNYPSALEELKKAGDAAGWRGRLAIARAHLFRNDYDLSLKGLNDFDRSAWYGKAIEQIITGPFGEKAPLAAPVLEMITPERRYRVVTDLGLKRGYVAGLQRKLAGIADPAARRKLVQRERKRHAGLRELAAVMDKAYSAYDKLFAVTRESEIIPTVFVFANREGFDRFSEKLMSGTAESTLGYYLPYYRIFVFYNLGGGGPRGRMLSEDTMKVLLHETFHQWVHLYVDGAPHWFNEGMAEYFGIWKMTPKEYRYGLLPRKTPSRLSNIRSALRGEIASPMPLDVLLQADGATFMSPDSAATNYAASWSFVHFLASSNGGQKRLRAYYQALRKGLNREQAYDEVFGALDIAALEKEWIAYVGGLTPK
jgi:hypothetical protein